MKASRVVFALSLIFVLVGSSYGEDEPAVKLPAKKNFHLFLLAGQSNMAGRGKIDKNDNKPHPRVVMLTKNGDWKPAVDPLHFDKPVAGVGLGRSFANLLADKDESIMIGLIPAACGGSPISIWEPGGYHKQTKSHPYDDAVKRTKIAMQQGVLKGILWHQGESDSKPGTAEVYQQKLTELIARFRKEFAAPELPFIIGQLGQFEKKPWTDARKTVDAAHQSIAADDSHVGFVSSKELTPRSDNVHFDAKSLREFGKRYASLYLKLASEHH